MQTDMYLTFLPMDLHTAYILYISLLYAILLVLLYKSRTSNHLLSHHFCSFLTISFLPYRLKDIVSIETNAAVAASTITTPYTSAIFLISSIFPGVPCS